MHKMLERENIEKAEYRSVRQRRLKEVQKEKLQNRADI